MGELHDMPDEILLHITGYLKAADVGKLQQCSKQLKAVTNDAQKANKELKTLKDLAAHSLNYFQQTVTTMQGVANHGYRVHKSWMKDPEHQIEALRVVVHDLEIEFSQVKKIDVDKSLLKACVQEIEALQNIWSKLDHMMTEWKKVAR